MIWIKCSERMPEPGVDVLLAYDTAIGQHNGRHVTYGHLRDTRYMQRPAGAWRTARGVLCDVTHWHPIPEPPKDGE